MRNSYWFQQPTRTQVIGFTLFWLTGILLQVAAFTNFFTTYVEKMDIAVVVLLWLPATVGLVKVHINYKRHHQGVA